MKKQTETMLQTLDYLSWFHAVGRKNKYLHSQFTPKNWSQAIELGDRIEWDNTLLDAQGDLTVFLHKHFRQEYQLWNSLMSEINTVIKPLCARKFKNLKYTTPYNDKIENNTTTYLRLILISCEYGELYTPTFFADLATWFFRGRYPCGYIGEYPYGQFIVY